MGIWLAYVLVLICIFIVSIEYLYLYALSSRTEARISEYNGTCVRIGEMIDTIVNAPTESSLRQALVFLKRYVGVDRTRMDILSGLLLKRLITENEEGNQNGLRALSAACDMVNPSAFYSSLLKTGDLYDKAYACRKISGFSRRQEISVIREFSHSKNRDLSYNAAMALSELGDESGLIDAIRDCQHNYEYSHRIIIELIQKYTGDMETLAKKVLCGISDDYIKTAVIKAVAKYRFQSLADIFTGLLTGTNVNLRAAALTALGALGDPAFQNDMITACTDPDWIIRLTAVKALKNIRTPESMQALSDAAQDAEWWVRNTAAKILVGMDTDLVYVERVLRNEDRRAADSILFALYQVCDMSR